MARVGTKDTDTSLTIDANSQGALEILLAGGKSIDAASGNPGNYKGPAMT